MPTNSSEDLGKDRVSYAAGGKVNQDSHYEHKYRSSQKTTIRITI